jgi:Zn-finger nucleic acid-binding protein
MDKKAFEGILVDRCPTCEGVWLDGGELSMLQHHEGKPVEQLNMEASAEAEEDRQRLVTALALCPDCQKSPLEEQTLAGVKVDVCPSCNGMYFDWGELYEVLEATESKGFMALIDKIREALT